ncbi:MAG: Gfo/Idh/MocA family oxidoreductase [Bryobacterales bacterium]|nr:Gfo/Idh/MocA family oxidoreductase [Bryobacterales bacterium]
MAATMTRRDFVAGAVLVGERPAPRTVRVGIVGGRFGATFQWHPHPRARVSAVCDIEPQALERLARVYRCGNHYGSFRELLGHPEPVAVGIFTPASRHAWMAIEAMKAGKHVLSAVPAGMTLEELERLIETVKRTGLHYMMAETSCYRPEIVTCRDWARRGLLGTIFCSECEYHPEGRIALMYDDRGLPTYRHGYPPMLYPTHCTVVIIPVTSERLVEVQAIRWEDGHEVLPTNL